MKWKKIDFNKIIVSRLLTSVEKVGNALPHPATLFGIMALAVLVLSFIVSKFNIQVTHPGTGETVTAINLLSVHGLHRILTEMVTNFTGFAPLGTVLVAARPLRTGSPARSDSLRLERPRGAPPRADRASLPRQAAAARVRPSGRGSLSDANAGPRYPGLRQRAGPAGLSGPAAGGGGLRRPGAGVMASARPHRHGAPRGPVSVAAVVAARG